MVKCKCEKMLEVTAGFAILPINPPWQLWALEEETRSTAYCSVEGDFVIGELTHQNFLDQTTKSLSVSLNILEIFHEEKALFPDVFYRERLRLQKQKARLSP